MTKEVSQKKSSKVFSEPEIDALLKAISTSDEDSGVFNYSEDTDKVTGEISSESDSKILGQSEIDELVKEIAGIENTERDYGYDDDDDTPMFSDLPLDANDKALKKHVNRQFKLIEFDSNLVLSFSGEIISRGGLLIALQGITESKKSFIKNLFTRFDWRKEVYRTIKKAEQQNKRMAESVSSFIHELKNEFESVCLNEDTEINFCGEKVKAAYVVNAIKLFDKYVNKTSIPRICELQKRIEDYIERLKKVYANHLPVFHIFMRKEIKVWQALKEFITKQGNFIWNTRNELVSILKK